MLPTYVPQDYRHDLKLLIKARAKVLVAAMGGYNKGMKRGPKVFEFELL